MRNIRFRGRLKDSEEWVYGGAYIIDGSAIIVDGDSKLGLSIHVVDPDTIGQNTGLQDKNGVGMFEGDIVRFTYWWFDGRECESELIGEIVYESEMMSFALKGIKNKDWLRHIGGDSNNTPDTAPFAFFQFDKADFGVIGNKFEHPELISAQ